MKIALFSMPICILSLLGNSGMASEIQFPTLIDELGYKQDSIVKVVKREFGFTFGAFLVEKPIMPDANFSAYYLVEEEGCGTECVIFNMTDLRTGEVIDSPKNCPGGFAYFPQSSLMICNSDTIEDFDSRQYPWYHPLAYFWDEQKREFVEIEGERKDPEY